MNVEVSNHMQALEDDQIKALDKKFKKNKTQTTNKILKIITKNLIINKIKIIKAINRIKINKITKVINKNNNQQKNQNKNGQNNKGKQQNKNNKTIKITKIINSKIKLQNLKKCLQKLLIKKELLLVN